MNLVVNTRGLTKKYSGKTVLHNINLEIPKGQVFALLGPNGSGKTTFFKLLTGLIRPSAGEAYCLGLNVTRRGRRIRQRACIVSEEPRFYDYLSVGELIRFCRELYPRWNNGLIDEQLGIFNISMEQKIRTLSHGMKKQLALLIALAPEPELLLLDEPSSSFDPIFRRQFLDIALENTIGAGKSVLIASHQLHEIERVADQVVFLSRGEILKQASLQEMKASMKQIKVVFQVEPPATFFAREGVCRVNRRDNTFFITVDNNMEAVWQACAQLPHFSLEMNNLNLEDIYFHVLGNREKKEGEGDVKQQAV